MLHSAPMGWLCIGKLQRTSRNELIWSVMAWICIINAVINFAFHGWFPHIIQTRCKTHLLRIISLALVSDRYKMIQNFISLTILKLKRLMKFLSNFTIERLLMRWALELIVDLIVQRAGLMRSQQDFEWWWSVPLSSAFYFVYSSQCSYLFWIMYLL